jgi:hypothetical protein
VASGNQTRHAGGELVKRELTHDEVLEAIERALMDNPLLRHAPVEELSGQLVLGGYLTEEPSLGLMVEVMTTIGTAEQEAFEPDVSLEGL